MQETLLVNLLSHNDKKIKQLRCKCNKVYSAVLFPVQLVNLNL